MKVMIVSRGYPSEKYKMNGIFEFDQAKALVEAGVDVVYAAIDVRSIRRWRKWGFESLKKEGVQIEAINIPCGKLPNYITDKIRELALKILYFKISKKYWTPDIIHSHFIGIGYISAKTFKNKGIPLVHTEHYSGMNQSKINSYYRKIGKYAYTHMNKVISVSNALRNNINKHFNIDSIVIPNVVDISSFEYNENKIDNNIFNFISVGNLIKLKNMDLLINAFHEAFKNNKNIFLYIFGDGAERKKLEQLIIQLDLRDKVMLMGRKSRIEISKKMDECNCFVLASQSETFGVAYIEALAKGIPVIATKCGGPEDFVNDENGVLIPVNDHQELVNALKFMHINSKKFNRKFIAKVIKNKFAPITIATNIINVYNDVFLEEKENCDKKTSLY